MVTKAMVMMMKMEIWKGWNIMASIAIHFDYIIIMKT